MKKIIPSLLVIFAILQITGCFDNIEDEEEKTSFYPEKKFWAQNMVTNEYYQLNAEKLAENSRCVVWAEKGRGVTVATANNVANAYYNTIYPKMMNTFGYAIDDVDLGEVDIMEIAHWLATGNTSDARLTILLLDIKDGYKPGVNDSYVGGYFHSLQLFEDSHSNELDMIYLDIYPSVPGSLDSNGTLAHEMQHLMNFVSSFLCRFDDDEEEINFMDIWIDEGLSSAAEWLCTGQSKERLDHYNNDPSGLIAKGNSFYVWGNHEENPYAILDDYATVYLFFQYLRLQSGKPNDIYFDIITSDFSDYRAVITAENINIRHNDNWSLLLRDWYAANYMNEISGLYGYKNDTKLKNVKAKVFPTTDTSVNLYPGEGVYSKTMTTDTLPPSTNNIKYAGLVAYTPVDSGYVKGTWLTYNVNTNKEGPFETGKTTGNAPSASISMSSVRSSVQIDSKKFSGPYKVDASYFNRRNGNESIPNINIRNIINSNNSRSITNASKPLNFDISTLKRVIADE